MGDPRSLALVVVAALGLSLAPAAGGPAARSEGASPWHEGSRDTAQSETHTYYVAAEPVAWDYAPSGRDRLTGARFDTTSARFPGKPRSEYVRYPNAVETNYAPGLQEGLETVGHVYRKVLYREYTDSTFTERVERPERWEHLGMLGPLLRAEVGDTIEVVFRNMADRPYSMHPHGVSYEKDSEGKRYRDGTSGADKEDGAVPPGETHTYVWPVPERAGPGPEEPSSKLWMYHSHVREDEDINTGLVGPMIVTRRGMAGPNGVPRDVDREFVTMFFSSVESDSWLYPENIREHTSLSVDSATAQPGFGNTHFMESVNGFAYANMPRPTMRVGENVRWYLFTGPNLGENHTIHWHANTALYRGRHTDMIDLGAMMMAVADMTPDNPGTWLYHCHVDVHFEAGMSAMYRVLPRDETAAGPDSRGEEPR